MVHGLPLALAQVGVFVSHALLSVAQSVSASMSSRYTPSYWLFTPFRVANCQVTVTVGPKPARLMTRWTHLPPVVLSIATEDHTGVGPAVPLTETVSTSVSVMHASLAPLPKFTHTWSMAHDVQLVPALPGLVVRNDGSACNHSQ